MHTYSLKKYAMIVSRELRKNQTVAEELLWDRIRKKKLMGCRFNRQYPFFFNYEGKERFFIADFFSYELGLIVEVDGKIHERQKNYDEIREEFLKAMKYNILRFKNEEIVDNLPDVLDEIKDFIKRKKSTDK